MWIFFTALIRDGLSKDSSKIHFVKEISTNLHLPLSAGAWPGKALSHALQSVKHWCVLAEFVFKMLWWVWARRLWHSHASASKEPVGEETCLSGGLSGSQQGFISARKKPSWCSKDNCWSLRNVLGKCGKVLGAQEGISVLVRLHKAPISLLHLSLQTFS